MFFINGKTKLSPTASLIIKIIGDVLANKHLYRIFFMRFFLFLNQKKKKKKTLSEPLLLPDRHAGAPDDNR